MSLRQVKTLERSRGWHLPRFFKALIALSHCGILASRPGAILASYGLVVSCLSVNCCSTAKVNGICSANFNFLVKEGRDCAINLAIQPNLSPKPNGFLERINAELKKQHAVHAASFKTLDASSQDDPFCLGGASGRPNVETPLLYQKRLCQPKNVV